MMILKDHVYRIESHDKLQVAHMDIVCEHEMGRGLKRHPSQAHA